MSDLSQGSREFLWEFIELYRSFPCLWQVKRKDYSDRIEKGQAYEALIEKYCRACGDYKRRGIGLTTGFIKHSYNTWLHFTVPCKTYAHTNLLSSGAVSRVVTSQLSHNSSGPRTSCRPTHCLRTPSSLTHGNSAASAGSVYSLAGTYSLAVEPETLTWHSVSHEVKSLFSYRCYFLLGVRRYYIQQMVVGFDVHPQVITPVSCFIA
jgi:hypothetical protein